MIVQVLNVKALALVPNAKVLVLALAAEVNSRPLGGPLAFNGPLSSSQNLIYADNKHI